MDKLKSSGKPFDISKWEVWEAFEKVKAQSRVRRGWTGSRIEEFEKDLQEQSVQDLESDVVGDVLSAAGDGGGDPEAARRRYEDAGRADGRVTESRRPWWPGTAGRRVEPVFHPDSYGYRPGRSALDAVERCRRTVLEVRTG